MANEINLSLSLRVNNGKYNDSFVAGGVSVDQTAQRVSAAIVTVATGAAQAISLGEVTTAGYAAFRNLSTATSGTAYIAIGSLSGTNLTHLAWLRRGQPAVVPLAGNITLGAQASATAPIALRYMILSE